MYTKKINQLANNLYTRFLTEQPLSWNSMDQLLWMRQDQLRLTSVVSGLPVTTDNTLGILSLLFWALSIVISPKYIQEVITSAIWLSPQSRV